MNRETSRPSLLRDDSIRHPFRQSLPHEMVQMARHEHAMENAEPAKRKGWGDDASLFVLSFFAFFTAFYTFIF